MRLVACRRLFGEIKAGLALEGSTTPHEVSRVAVLLLRVVLSLAS